jgi:hypothetical protein
VPLRGLGRRPEKTSGRTRRAGPVGHPWVGRADVAGALGGLIRCDPRPRHLRGLTSAHDTDAHPVTVARRSDRRNAPRSHRAYRRINIVGNHIRTSHCCRSGPARRFPHPVWRDPVEPGRSREAAWGATCSNPQPKAGHRRSLAATARGTARCDPPTETRGRGHGAAPASRAGRG